MLAYLVMWHDWMMAFLLMVPWTVP